MSDKTEARNIKESSLCFDCKKAFDVPFSNGDGKARCSDCAIAFYKRDWRWMVVPKQKPFAVML